MKCSSKEKIRLLISKVAPEFQEERVKMIVIVDFLVSKVYKAILITSCMSYIHLLYMFSLHYTVAYSGYLALVIQQAKYAC